MRGTSSGIIGGHRQVNGSIADLVRLFCLSIAATCCATSGALAQQPSTADGSQGVALEEVVVTGTRISAVNAISTSPIQVITADSLRVTGRTDITDVINQLPQNFVNDLGQDLGNGTPGLTSAGGVATADLRGLGPNRTLVLVDGRRLGIGSPSTLISSPAPDLDQIPSGLVERVEVVTGGASAAYGSDAIAGVVNFIMKRNFQGFQVDAQWNADWHSNHNDYAQGLVRDFDAVPASGTTWDGKQRTFDVLMGTDFADGKGNVTAYLSYRHADPVASSQRDFGSCQMNPNFDDNGNKNGLFCAGSSNSNWFQPVTGPNPGAIYNVSGHSFVPAGSVADLSPPATFNSQPYIFMTRQDDRYNAAVLAHDEVRDYFQPYAEFYFMDDRTTQDVAPAALFKDSNVLDPTGRGDYFINCSNPLLSAQQQATLCTPAEIAADAANPGSSVAQVRIGRRNVEGGGRASDYQHQNYRAALGSKGDLGQAWNYDLYFQYYYTSFFQSNEGYLSFDSITNALLATGSAAAPVCINNASRGCVPYNPFIDGGVTQAQLNYLYLLGTAQGTATLRTWHGDITGQLGDYGLRSPLATDGIAVNIGLEHRNEQQTNAPDAAQQSGLLSGFGSAVVPLNASESVNEQFIEIRAPLIQNARGAKDLLFDVGYRRSDYETSGVANTYKFEVQYAPIEDYRFRFSYDRAVRAPALIELFGPPNVGLAQAGSDPCAPTYDILGQISAPATYTLQQCERTGVTAAQYGNGGTTNTIPQGTAGQLSALSSGNVLLRPERADTYTVGLNIVPRSIPHFQASIDYYQIKVQDTISTLPTSLIMSNCANTGDPAYCSQLVRAPSTGGLTGTSVSSGGYFIQKLYNLGEGIVSGIDTQLAYRFDLPRDLGALAIDLNGTWLQHAKTQPLPGAPTYDCAGLFGYTCQTINPRWQHTLRATWIFKPALSIDATWRYIGSVNQDNNSSDPSLHFSTWGAYDYYNAHIASYSYLDLGATWEMAHTLTVRAGINNILDKDPPLLDTNLVTGGAANTYSRYDLFGRQVFLGFTAKF